MKAVFYFFSWLLVSTSCFAEAAVIAWYSEQESGTEPETVRYIVTDKFMRSDNGSSEQGFVLLDRQQKKIFNIVPDTQSILVIDGKGAIPVAPEAFVIRETDSTDPDAPRVNGKVVHEIHVSSDKQLCYSAMVAPGLYDVVRQAQLEFSQVLAVQQSRVLERTPENMRTGCFMIQYLYAPARHLLSGLPVREWDKDGKTRQLLDLQTVPVDSGLFELPQGYRQYSPWQRNPRKNTEK